MHGRQGWMAAGTMAIGMAVAFACGGGGAGSEAAPAPAPAEPPPTAVTANEAPERAPAPAAPAVIEAPAPAAEPAAADPKAAVQEPEAKRPETDAPRSAAKAEEGAATKPAAEAPSAEPAAAAKPAPTVAGPCGDEDQPPCPLQGWMEKQLQQPFEADQFARVAPALEHVAKLVPDPSWNAGATGWATLAQAGAAAARNSDRDGVQQACKGCHKAWRSKYKAAFRLRAIE